MLKIDNLRKLVCTFWVSSRLITDRLPQGGSSWHALCCCHKVWELLWPVALENPSPLIPKLLPVLQLKAGCLEHWSHVISSAQAWDLFQTQTHFSWCRPHQGKELRTLLCWSEVCARLSRCSTGASSSCLSQRVDLPCCLLRLSSWLGWSSCMKLGASQPCGLCPRF